MSLYTALTGSLYNHYTEAPTVKSYAVFLYKRARAEPATLVFFGAIFFSLSLSLFLLSFPAASAEAQVPAVSAGAADSGPRPLEMHIAENGLMLLRSAKVTAIDGTTLTLSTAWGRAEFAWQVQTDGSTYDTHEFGTRFMDHEGKRSSLLQVHLGDLVTVTGTLDPSAQEPTIKADSVRILR